jgi:tripartite-type tricarboxylate transporter receptor subunit TctC
MGRILNLLSAAVLTAALCALPGVNAQPAASAQPGTAAWPERPVRIVIGFPPGQATDRTARLIAEKLTARLGQTVIVENRPGQAGSIALAALKRAPADGYTVGLAATASMATNPHLYKSVGYDPLEDFRTVSILGKGPLLLLANSKMPFDSTAGFVKYAKDHPGRLNYCSTGNGTISHLAMELFKREAGITLTHVPYQGSVAAMGDLANGDVSVCFDTVAGALPMLKAGKIKALGVAVPERMDILPDLPTLSETGFKGFEAAPYVGMLVPAGTPTAIIDRLHAELREIGAMPDIRDQLKSTGMTTIFSSPDAFAKQLRMDFDKWRKVIRDADIRLE